MNENATMGKLVGVALTITVAIIIIASAMMPVISDAQRATADKITLSNDYEVWRNEFYVSDSDFELSIDNSGLITIGDYTRQSTNSYIVPILIKDFYMKVHYTNAQTGIILISDSEEMVSRTDIRGPVSFVFSNGAYVLTIGDSEYTGNAAECYHLCDEADAEYMATQALNDHVLSSVDQIMVEYKDVAGWYYKGSTLDNTYSDPKIRVTASSIKEGTTDLITDISIVFYDGETIITPQSGFVSYIPIEVSGHATSGAAYSVLGVIPAMVIVALLGAAIPLVRSKME